jgi:zinc D-Ala-D-Ala carboxypeptidase
VIRNLSLAFILGLTLAGCGAPEHPMPTEIAVAIGVSAASSTPTSEPAASATMTPVIPSPSPSPPPSPLPADTATATPSSTPTATTTMTPTAIPLCKERQPAPEDLLALVNHEFGLSVEFKPEDLVPLADYFRPAVTRGYPTQVRAVIIPPLEELIAAMHAEELRPFIVSGFRSYYDQSAARQKWAEQFPEWVHNISARPGHSEHQLGTTVDFSTPDLPYMVGEPFIEFHPAFAVSGEGKWLAEHAQEYGFTMSYPDDRYAETGFDYEPWHFRYIGVDLSTLLYENEVTISEYVIDLHGAPCQP